MSYTEEILSKAHSVAAVAMGQLSLAIAARRYRRGAPVQWAKALRSAAVILDQLAEKEKPT